MKSARVLLLCLLLLFAAHAPALAFFNGCILNLSENRISGEMRVVGRGDRLIGRFTLGPNDTWCERLAPDEYQVIFELGDLRKIVPLIIPDNPDPVTEYALGEDVARGSSRIIYWLVKYDD